MSSHLVDGLGTTDALAAVFSDESVLQAMLDVESALARVQAALGVIPKNAATAIATVARADQFDAAALGRGARASGTPIVPLVAAFRARVASVDASAASFVHWGVTSQDISDTALVMLLKRTLPLIGGTQARLAQTLRATSNEHAGTLMAGRTLLQPATPITFGLKVATWYASIHRSWRALQQSIEAAAVVQCGGPAGTLAGHGRQGNRRPAGARRGVGVTRRPALAHRSRAPRRRRGRVRDPHGCARQDGAGRVVAHAI